MASDYYAVGTRIRVGQLSLDSGIRFGEAVRKHNYAWVKRVVRDQDREGVEFDIRVQILRDHPTNIKKIERICVLFSNDAGEQPKVLAMRKDFPGDLQHMNLTRAGDPRSLCLFAQEYRELVRIMTAELLLERISSWLDRAARDEQHLPDQPLEAFFGTSERVIIPPEMFTTDPEQAGVLAMREVKSGGNTSYVIERFDKNRDIPGIPMLVIPLITDAWHARILQHVPTSLEGLRDVLNKLGRDVVEIIREETKKLEDHPDKEILMKLCWALAVLVPKIRVEGGQVESYETLVFVITKCIGKVGEAVGCLMQFDGGWRFLISGECGGLDGIGVIVVNAVNSFDRETAKKLSGVATEAEKQMTVIGAGALGSQVIMNLARQGIGIWNIIDKDVLLPHNGARHIASSNYVGVGKSDILAEEICKLLNDTDAAQSSPKDVFSLYDSQDELKRLTECDHILDFSVSPAVSRYLALINSNAPRTCGFLLQDGRFLVIISEGTARFPRLDDLEIQLYIETLENRMIKRIFHVPKDLTYRYGRGCRDVSTILAQDVVATHAGITSQYIKKRLNAAHAEIAVWRIAEGDLTVSRIDVRCWPVVCLDQGGWAVRLSGRAHTEMQHYRRRSLPNETGGILLGMFDVREKTVYIGGIVPSPPDSDQWPDCYIRGMQGVHAKIDAVKDCTGGKITYVGEWHSHPINCSSVPSSVDKKAHRTLGKLMDQDGLPAVMLIQGDSNIPGVLI